MRGPCLATRISFQTFYKAADGTCTNTIEAKWGGLKRNISPRNRNNKDVIQEHLLEQVWRSQNQDALWNGFIRALKQVKYEGPPESDEEAEDAKHDVLKKDSAHFIM